MSRRASRRKASRRPISRKIDGAAIRRLQRRYRRPVRRLAVAIALQTPATLVTGLKRDIALLERVQAAPAMKRTPIDLSMQRNWTASLSLLDAGVHVR